MTELDLKTNWLGKPLLLFDEIHSTNQYCKEHLQQLNHGSVVMADCQRQGRGSRDRKWAQKPGQSLAISMVLSVEHAEVLQTLTLVTALAAVYTLESFDLHPCIKWPNDLLLDGGKITGILCEGSFTERGSMVVCGIGINLLQSREWFDSMNLPYAGSVFSQTGKRLSLERVAADFLVEFEECFDRWQSEGFSMAFLSDYKKRCITCGREVMIQTKQGRIYGVAKKVTTSGGLLCQIGNQEKVFFQNEASVRGLMGYF